MKTGCLNCGCMDYIDSGKEQKTVMNKHEIYTEQEVICKECGYEYGLRFVFGEYIGSKSVEL